MSKDDGLKVFLQRYSHLWTDESQLKGQDFQPQSTDVFVTGSLKSGTTWLQQIIHQLRTGGDMDFEDIADVVQVVDFAYDLQQDLDGEQKGFPRCFKIHFWYPRCPKGAKYIWCVCEPCACAYSYFKMHMFEGWFFQPGGISGRFHQGKVAIYW